MAVDHSKRDDEEDINLTPMLDIVFIMLIFFIVTATFVKETGLDPDKPDARLGQAAPLASILVGIAEDCSIHIEQREVELGAVRGVIAKLAAENPKGSMSIQATEEAPARCIVDVTEEAKAAGVNDIIVSTEPL
ncbi:MAG: ExbD/TolR family protein [Alphaproteobacteria bacterium]